MANKRMFSLSVVDTDIFLEMPITSRLLYYELGIRADDDGFVGNWKKILRMTSLSEDDMKILIAKRFIIPFESGVIVIRHWRMNNYLRNDRYTPTVYQKELLQLSLENNVYELESTQKSTMLPSGIPMVYTGKDSIDKDSIGKSNKKTFIPPTIDEIKNYIAEKSLNVDAKKFYDYFTEGNWTDSNGKKVKNWKQKLLTWNGYSKVESKTSVNNSYHNDNQDIDFSNYYAN